MQTVVNNRINFELKEIRISSSEVIAFAYAYSHTLHMFAFLQSRACIRLHVRMQLLTAWT